jgi:phosphate transport system protein
MTAQEQPENQEHHHVRQHFDEELETIKDGLAQMGSLVVENTRRAGEACVENRLELVSPVRKADLEINELYRNLEEQVFETLALQQPVAGDLRFLIAATRMLYEVERSGDLAVNIVNSLARNEGFPAVPKVIGLLSLLVEQSSSLFATAVDAIADLDPEVGLTIDEMDDVVDDTTSEYFQAVSDHSEELQLEASVQLSRIGRYLERIADHGVNLGENVTYIVTGQWPNDEDAALADG